MKTPAVVRKLGLGTVQFGMPYGVSNSQGQPTAEEVARILTKAHLHGVRCLDTAAFYGSSESVLGASMPQGHTFEIVTKTPHFAAEVIGDEHASLLGATFEQSLQRLGADAVYGLLLHNADDLLRPGAQLLVDALLSLKRAGKVKHVGASIYNDRQIARLLELPGLDLVQVPINLLDQRLISSGALTRLKSAGFEIHARSVFLQGLLLMPTETLPSRFQSVRNHLRALEGAAASAGVSMLQASLGFVLGLSEIDRVLVGVNSSAEFEQILDNSQKLPDLNELAAIASWSDENILNPALWGKHA